MTREADNPMTECDFDWMVSNHAVWGWKAPVKASVSGVSLLQLSPFFASIFPLFPPETPDTQARLDETSRRIYETLLKYRFVGDMFLQEIIIAIRALGYSNAAK